MEEVSGTPLFPLSLLLDGSSLDSAHTPSSQAVEEDAQVAACSSSPEAEQVRVQGACARALEDLLLSVAECGRPCS